MVICGVCQRFFYLQVDAKMPGRRRLGRPTPSWHHYLVSDQEVVKEIYTGSHILQPFIQEEEMAISKGRLSIPELARERNLKVSWLYERSRRGELPGQERYGRLIRVDLDEFDRGVKAGLLA